AKLVVSTADEKEFHGKNSVKAQATNQGNSHVKVPDVKKGSDLRVKGEAKKPAKSTIQKITPSQSSNDEWEAF
ncbi:MAG: methyl-accepting chemotaxis protein, partial [Campylobacterota bacterium]